MKVSKKVSPIKILLIMCCGSLALGCNAMEWARLQPRPPLATVKKEMKRQLHEIEILLAYYRHLDTLSEKALNVERLKTQKAFSKFKDPIHRLKFAMILTMPEHPEPQDADLALNLVENYLSGSVPIDPVLRDFSLFLAASIRQDQKREAEYRNLDREHRKREEDYKGLVRKIKDRDKQYQTLSKRLKAEEAQSEKLEKIIEALKTIEENIMKRDENIDHE
ncbi:MAG: hypothetical protein ACE5GK_08605 [Nitrospiria bacterium]